MLRVLLARRYVYQLRNICHSIESDEIHVMLTKLCQRMAIYRPPTLLACDYVSPMLMGISHPAIVLPVQLLEEDNAESLRLVLAHELAHLRRRDLLWNRLAILMETLFFFHPLVWVSTREGQLAQEIACDEMALRSSGAASVDYARMLVDIATCPSRLHRFAPSAVGISESFITLKRRLQAMRWNRGVTRIQMLVVGMVVVLLGSVLAAWHVVPHSPKNGLYGTTLRRVFVSPDGRHVAIQYEDDLISAPGRRIRARDVRYNETVEIRDLAAGKLEQKVQYHNIRGIADMAFSRDNRALLISLREYTRGPFSHPKAVCYRFGLDNGKLEKAMSEVSRLWINQNGNTLWTDIGGPCINDGYESHTYLAQRDLRTGKELRRLPPLNGFIKSISPDGTRAVTNCYGYILASDRRVLGYRDVSMVVWDLSTGKQLVTLEGKGIYPSYANAFSSDGSMFAASEQDESTHQKSPSVHVWNVKSGKLVCTLTGNTGNVREVAFSPDGKKLTGVDYSGQVILWDISQGKADWVWQGNDARGIAFTTNGKQVITGSNRNNGTSSNPVYIPGPLTILDVETGQPVRAINP